MNKQKDIQKLLEDDGFKVVSQAVLPDRAQDMAALQEVEKAQDYLNLMKNRSERERTAPPAPAEKVPDFSWDPLGPVPAALSWADRGWATPRSRHPAPARTRPRCSGP